MTFQHLTKNKEVYEYQYFISDTFQITDSGDKTEMEILDDYIKSDYFTEDYSVEREISKESSNHGPFDIKGLVTTDFKKIKSSDIDKVIENIANDNDWGDDLEYFKQLWAKLRERIDDFKLNDGTIFHLNKYWFKPGDRQLVKDWDYVFIYYLTFIYVSADKNKLVCFDLGYD